MEILKSKLGPWGVALADETVTEMLPQRFAK